MKSIELPEDSPELLSQQRFCEALSAILDRTQLSQRKLAAKLDIPVQYLSDYKQGRRSLSERVARRFEEHYGYPWRWLRGQTDDLAPPTLHSAALPHDLNGMQCLPILGHPIEGEPRRHPKWDGALMEVNGAAQAKLAQASMPYVLRFGADDCKGRLYPGDLLLMSQSPPAQDASYESYIQVIRVGRGLYLARRSAKGWVRLATISKGVLPASCTVHGHAIGILWGSLL